MSLETRMDEAESNISGLQISDESQNNRISSLELQIQQKQLKLQFSDTNIGELVISIT